MVRGHRTGFSEERTGPYLRGRRDGLGPHREEENQEAKESADERVEEEGEELERLAERADAVDGAVVDAAEGGGERETDEEAGDEAVDRKQLRPKGGTVERPSEKEENVDGEEKVAKGNESVKTRGEVAVGVLDFPSSRTLLVVASQNDMRTMYFPSFVTFQRRLISCGEPLDVTFVCRRYEKEMDWYWLSRICASSIMSLL